VLTWVVVVSPAVVRVDVACELGVSVDEATVADKVVSAEVDKRENLE
jgi:hypothetical protein